MWSRQRHKKVVLLHHFFHPAEFYHSNFFPINREAKLCVPGCTWTADLKIRLNVQKTVVFLRKQPFFMVRVARLELAASWSQTRRPTNWATPGYLLLLFAQSGQTCGQIPFSTAQGGLSVEIFLSAATAFLLSRETQHFPCSSSQTRRPTNWATPGYLLLCNASDGHSIPPQANCQR